jgi:hypothetical protein
VIVRTGKAHPSPLVRRMGFPNRSPHDSGLHHFLRSDQQKLPLGEVTQLKYLPELELEMKKPVSADSASALIDKKIKELGDWRGKTLAKVRDLIHAADPEIVEEWKWMGTPVFSHCGIVCTGETYKSVVKMTFAKGAALKDPAGLFNSSLEGNVRRAIDIHEDEKIKEAALKDLIRAAVALNLEGRTKPKPKPKLKSGQASTKRAG